MTEAELHIRINRRH